MWTNSSSKQAPIYSTVEMVRAARPCLLPLLLLSLLVSYSIAPLKLKPPQPLSLPFLCPPRNVEQLLTLDLVLSSPTLGPLLLVLCYDSKGNNGVRFRREQKQTNKNQTLPSLCFPYALSPWPRSSVRNEIQTKEV